MPLSPMISESENLNGKNIVTDEYMRNIDDVIDENDCDLLDNEFPKKIDEIFSIFDNCVQFSNGELDLLD